jgi:hypothetical protein
MSREIELNSEHAQTHATTESSSDNSFSEDNSLDDELDDIENELGFNNDEEKSETNDGNFNEFALKHISELLINLLTNEDKNVVYHLNNNFQQLSDKLDILNEHQKNMIKVMEENTKVNKVVAKLLEKMVNKN